MKKEKVVIHEKVTNWIAIIFVFIINVVLISLYLEFLMFGYDIFVSSSAGINGGKFIFFLLQHMFLAFVVLFVLTIHEEWKNIRWKEKRRTVEIERR